MNSDTPHETAEHRSRNIDFLAAAIRDRTVFGLLVLFGGATIAILWQHSRIQTDNIQASAIRDAARYTDVVREFRTLYSSEVVAKVEHCGIEVSHDYKGKAKTIPLPATLSMDLGNRIASAGTGGETRLYSDFPFPWREETGGLNNDFAKDAWDALNQKPDQPFWRIEDVNGRPSLRYATADLMRKSCVQCHNSHEHTPKSDWQVGDVRGVLEVITPFDQALAESQASRREFALLTVALLVPGLITVVLVLVRLRASADKQAAWNEKLRSENMHRLQAEAAMQSMNEFLERRADELKRSRIAALNMMRDAECSEKLQREHAKALILANRQLEKEMTEREQAQSEREQMHQQLVDSSRLAGMAEVATGVLHNVGNVLNSVNVSANVMLEKIGNNRVDLLSKASQELSRHQDDLAEFVTEDSRGRHFPKLLDQLAVSLQSDRDSQRDELRSLLENIEHIKQIVNRQQSFACVSGATELLELPQLLDDALRMHDTGLSRHDIEIVCEFDDAPPVLTERHKMMQILVNLIGNAKNALNETNRANRTMTLIVAIDGDHVCIRVRDNGVGIEQANLTKVFTHGFTTRKEGHGFGLHSSALAAQELGGSLSVHSDGIGLGTTFTLRIPMKKETLCKV